MYMYKQHCSQGHLPVHPSSERMSSKLTSFAQLHTVPLYVPCEPQTLLPILLPSNITPDPLAQSQSIEGSLSSTSSSMRSKPSQRIANKHDPIPKKQVLLPNHIRDGLHKRHRGLGNNLHKLRRKHPPGPLLFPLPDLGPHPTRRQRDRMSPSITARHEFFELLAPILEIHIPNPVHESRSWCQSSIFTTRDQVG